VKSGHAYVSSGDVLYDSKTFQTYGKLSGKNLEELIEGARVEKNDTKKNPTDFVLWKTAKLGEPSGIRPGAKAVLAGILSVRPWCESTWGIRSISTVAELISFPPS